MLKKLRYLAYLFDYYIGYFAYKSHQPDRDRYYTYMYYTYGDLFCTTQQWDEYWAARELEDDSEGASRNYVDQ